MANKVKFGLKNVKIAPITATTPAYTYDTVFALLGAVNLSTDASGDEETFYADDVAYYVTYGNQGYSGTLEIADINEDFKTKILGWTADANGALLETAADIITPFAMGFEISGDKAGRRCWLYNCTVSRPGTNAATNEATKTPQTDTLQIAISPRSTDQAVKIVMEETTSNTAKYATFFSTVYEAE